MFKTLASLGFPSMSGPTPSPQQNWQSSEKSQHLKEKHNFNEHPIGPLTPAQHGWNLQHTCLTRGFFLLFKNRAFKGYLTLISSLNQTTLVRPFKGLSHLKHVHKCRSF